MYDLTITGGTVVVGTGDKPFDADIVIGDPPDYEPTPDHTVGAISRECGADPLATMYDLMLESDGTAMLMPPFFNYVEGNHDAVVEMMSHRAAVSGLSDGGAHCGLICDASYPTFRLTHWARDRGGGPRFPLEYWSMWCASRSSTRRACSGSPTVARWRSGRRRSQRHRPRVAATRGAAHGL